jgi:kumamolisin
MSARRKQRAPSIEALFCFLLIGILTAACDTGNSSADQKATPTTAPTQQITQNYQPSLATSATEGSPLSPNTLINLTINLAYNTDAVNQALAQPNQSATFLTPEQIAQRYGLPTEQIQKVTGWLQQQGVTIVSTNAFNTMIEVQAPVSLVEKALSVKLSTYTLDDQTFFMPKSAPIIPEIVKPYVQSVIGLNNLARFTARPNNAAGMTNEADQSTNCTRYNKAASKGFHVRDSLAGAYQFDQLYNQGYEGQGMTIGVAAFDETYNPADIQAYLHCAGITETANIENVDINPITPDPELGQAGAGESALDLELIAGLAPKANILVYQNSQKNGGAQSMLELFSRVAKDHRVQALNVSYGSGEGRLNQVDMLAIAQSIQMLALQGIPVFVASGDCGAFGERLPNVASVSFPASAPYAIAVGGTDVQVNNKNVRTGETSWSGELDSPLCSNGWGTGGGVSINSFFKRPSWQVGPGTTNQYNGGSSAVMSPNNLLQPVVAPNGLRQVPDIAAAADKLAIYHAGEWIGVAGTSAAAPIWTAGAILLQQALKESNQSLNSGASQFYTMANAPKNFHPFNDITKGNNQFYPATTGWDYTTGWGSPNFNEILKWIKAQ